MEYYSNIPTKLDKSSMSEKEWIKARTQELYDMLPLTTLEERNSYTDIRDEIIALNYSFFGYVAKEKYIADPQVTYEDKLQSALLAFCQNWAKYKFTPKYRDDLSFSVFFKPRISECIGRELNPIKYSLRRTICMKAAKQLGKPWGKLTREDIKLVNLPPNEMKILEAIFSNRYSKNIDSPDSRGLTRDIDVKADVLDEIYTENYDDLEDLIVHEMIESESKLSDSQLLKMSEMYGIPFDELVNARPIGEAKLQKQLEEAMFIKDTFEYAGYTGSDSADDAEDE
jgi:hypothetical protein